MAQPVLYYTAAHSISLQSLAGESPKLQPGTALIASLKAPGLHNSELKRCCTLNQNSPQEPSFPLTNPKASHSVVYIMEPHKEITHVIK